MSRFPRFFTYRALLPLEETLQPVECKKIPMLDVDELRSFVFRSTENTCRILWDRVPSAYKEAIVFSDYWSAYQAVIPSEQQRLVGKETEETAHIERWNNTLRQQLACFENSSYTAIIPNYCRLLARYHFENHHY